MEGTKLDRNCGKLCKTRACTISKCGATLLGRGPLAAKSFITWITSRLRSL